jgi:hypothetical protein
MRKFKASYGKKYKDNQGQEKTSWKTIGFANEVVSQDGKTTIHLTLDSIPTGNWDGDVKLFLQDENQNSNNNGYQQNTQQQQGYQAPSPTYENNQGQQISQQQYNQQQNYNK